MLPLGRWKKGPPGAWGDTRAHRQPSSDGPEGSSGLRGTPISPGLTKTETQPQSACQAPALLAGPCPEQGWSQDRVGGRTEGWAPAWRAFLVASRASTVPASALSELGFRHRVSSRPPPSCPVCRLKPKAAFKIILSCCASRFSEVPALMSHDPKPMSQVTLNFLQMVTVSWRRLFLLAANAHLNYSGMTYETSFQTYSKNHG